MSTKFTRGRCPLCQKTSPPCDVEKDVNYKVIRDWWMLHQKKHMPPMIWEKVPGNELEG